jgi:hypothetical protein
MSNASVSKVDRLSWSSTDSSFQGDGLLQERIASLIDGNDCDNFSIGNDSFRLDETRLLSPILVFDFDADSQVAKRRKSIDLRANTCAKRTKVYNFDARVPELPKQIARPSWKRPVCTFLNYFGSRLPNVRAEQPGPKLAESNSVPTAMALFPVCPCKLRHQVLKGSNATAPPILKFLSSTGICEALSPSSIQAVSDTHERTDLDSRIVEGANPQQKNSSATTLPMPNMIPNALNDSE